MNAFDDIREDGHDGCGFIDEELMFDLIGRTKDGAPTAVAARCNRIQVRCFIPMMGIYKGMLMRKRLG